MYQKNETKFLILVSSKVEENDFENGARNGGGAWWKWGWSLFWIIFENFKIVDIPYFMTLKKGESFIELSIKGKKIICIGGGVTLME